MSDYSDPEYWDERYANHPELFDWYQIYPNLKDYISLLLSRNDNVLNCGAGTSNGFTNITDVDFSENAVKIMTERYKERNIKINYEQMNVTDMSAFEKGQFQAVLDKGNLDSILCGEDAIPIGYKYLREVDRVLSDKGIFICISYGDEEHRKNFFKNQDWSIKIEKIAKPNKIISSNINPDEKDDKNFHHVYIMNKNKNG